MNSEMPSKSGWYWIEDDEIESGSKWVMGYLCTCVGEPHTLTLFTPGENQEAWHLVSDGEGGWVFDLDYAGEQETSCSPLCWVPAIAPGNSDFHHGEDVK